jgi:hypothetical protein
MTSIEKKVADAIAACSEAFSEMAASSQQYISAHDIYLESTVKDATFIKDRIKRAIERIYDED